MIRITAFGVAMTFGGLMELIASTALHRMFVTGVAVSPDGTLIASSSVDGTIRLVPVDGFAAGAGAKMKQPRANAALAGVPSLVFHPNRPFLVAVGGMRNAVLWDITSPRAPKQLSHLSRLGRGIWAPWGSAVTPDGNVLAIGGAGNAITLVDLSNPSEPRLPSGATPNPRPSLSAPRARALSFHPSGNWLAAGGSDGSLAIWLIAGPFARRTTELPAHSGVVQSVSFSADGSLLATAGADDKTVVWSTVTPSSPQVRSVISAQNGPIAAFSPVAPILAVGDGFAANGTIQLWDVSSPAFPAQVGTAATQRTSALAWSPDGQTLAAGYLGGKVALWRAVA